MAASYEARRFGVRSAMAAVTAKRLCLRCCSLSHGSRSYKEVSARSARSFWTTRRWSNRYRSTKPISTLRPTSRNMPLASEIAREIRARILAETGLTASAGISYNKFLAKLASDHRKPNGQFTIRPEEGPEFVASLAVGKFHGIGPATRPR